MSIELSGKSRLRDLGSKPRAVTPSTFWVVSELYYPQETATGYLLTQLAEGLAKGRAPGCGAQEEIGVICAMPQHLPQGSELPADEDRAGVHIHRCRATDLNKDNLLLRLANAATQTLALAWAALRRVRRGDAVLVVTNPPTLPFLVALICSLKQAPCILLVHDLYPDAAVAAGVLKEGCWAVRIAGRLNRELYRHAEVIPVHRLAYSFGWGGPRQDNGLGSSLIEIDLIDQGGGTLLRMTHSGLPDAEECVSHEKGWTHYFERLGLPWRRSGA